MRSNKWLRRTLTAAMFVGIMASFEVVLQVAKM